MADRIFKGIIKAKSSYAFPEAALAFDKPHTMGDGLTPFEMLKEVLQSKHEIKTIGKDLWLSTEDVWIKIQPNGTIEIGASGT